MQTIQSNPCYRGRLSALALTLMMSGAVMMGQTRTVTGTVVDASGEPVIGANVVVKGTTTGTITDIDGNFSLAGVADNAVLHVSYIGYAEQDVTVKGQSQFNITIQEDNDVLDEVVVIGFGTVKKRDLTGSVASIKSESITQTPASNVTSSLQGRIAGLDVAPNADGKLDMRIRGNRSINGSNAPLVIIDGVQGGSMGDLNPNDIESVDVLKDASSTAIYGSQGANGVIIITTKKAEKGKMAVSYDGYTSFGLRPEHPEYRRGENYYEARRIAAANAGNWTSAADDLALFDSPEAFAAYKANVWTNYEDLLQRDVTLSHKHSVTLSGGTDKTSARFSLGYSNDGSKWEKSGGTDKYTLRANIDHAVVSWLSAGVNFQLTHNRNEASPYEKASTTGMQLGSPYGYYDADNATYLIGSDLVQRPLNLAGYVNPLIDNAAGALYAAESHSTNVVANAYLDIHPLDGLTFRSQFNAHLTNSTSGNYLDRGSSKILHDYPGAEYSTANYSKNSGTYVEWNNILTYNFKMLPKDHHLGLTLLTSYQQSMKDGLSATSRNQLSSANLWYNLASNGGADGDVTHSSSYTQTQNFSYAARVSYDWQGRYLLTASLRRDGASVLAEGHKWATFPSAALAWRVSDEPWMQKAKDSNWMDDFKLRATYGVTGNSGIGAYGTQSGVTFAYWSFGFQDTQANRYVYSTTSGGKSIPLLGNTETKWELSHTWDIGFDWTLAHDRVNVVFDWYNTNTTDLILLRDVPSSAGGYNGSTAFQLYQNIGETRNRGFELAINAQLLKQKNFQWNTTLTFSANSEKVTKLITGNTLVVGEKERGTYIVGRPIKSFITFKYDGIWTSDEAARGIQQINSNTGNPFLAGDIRVEDFNGDGTIDDNDCQYLGSTSPKWFAGWNNDFSFRNFDLNIYMYTRWGHWGENNYSIQASNGGNYTTYDYWVAGTNEGGSWPMMYSGRQPFEYYGYQSTWFVDKSFVKIKRITLGYTLPKKAATACHLSKLRVYATANDPFHWEKEQWMEGWDPEGNQRSFTLGLNINL